MPTDIRFALQKIEKINTLLESRFGLRVGASSLEHMVDVLAIYEGKRNSLISSLGESEAMKQPAYAKAVLISEAIRVLIREIAPKRNKKKKR